MVTQNRLPVNCICTVKSERWLNDLRRADDIKDVALPRMAEQVAKSLSSFVSFFLSCSPFHVCFTRALAPLSFSLSLSQLRFARAELCCRNERCCEVKACCCFCSSALSLTAFKPKLAFQQLLESATSSLPPPPPPPLQVCPLVCLSSCALLRATFSSSLPIYCFAFHHPRF